MSQVFLFELAKLREEAEEYDKKMSEPDFWNDNNKAQEIINKSKDVKDKIKEYDSISEELEDIEVMIELAEEEKEESLLNEGGTLEVLTYMSVLGNLTKERCYEIVEASIFLYKTLTLH